MPKTWTDTYVTTAADGSITFDFTGKIHARGLDIDAGGSAAGNNNRLRWIRASDGARVANLLGYNPSGDIAHLALTAGSPDFPGQTTLQLTAASTGFVGQISVMAKKVIDGNGTSDFMLEPSGFSVVSRGFSTWYAGSSTRATLVTSGFHAGGAGVQASVYIRTPVNTQERILIAGGGTSGLSWYPLSFIIPPGGEYYFANDTGGSPPYLWTTTETYL